MPISSQPLSAKKTRAAVAAQGSALNRQAGALKATIEHLDAATREIERIKADHARFLAMGLGARLKWLVLGA
jgi:hypothetical protein